MSWYFFQEKYGAHINELTIASVEQGIMRAGLANSGCVISLFRGGPIKEMTDPY